MNKKITCISDTHSLHEGVKTTGGDILIFAGDWQGRDGDNPYHFLAWLLDQSYSHIVVVLGNHDRNYDGIRIACQGNERIHLLHDSEIEIYGLKFYGTPWTNQFFNWAYMANEEVLDSIFSKIPNDTNVLVSHSPAFGILDKPRYMDSGRIGSRSLLKKIKTLTKLQLHVFGHIHESHGVVEGLDYIAVNASQLNESYRLINKPVDIIL